ncbi:VOC family protein [Mesorhizobium sp. M0243]|uniref:VOC family protein n=1 Tax=Mesorhizobium sp. M0243 TaxID=2956925 RepID=UPI003336A8B1
MDHILGMFSQIGYETTRAKMKPHKFEHIGLRVKDAERSIKFYSEVIGMEVRERQLFFRGAQLIFLTLGGQEIELIAGGNNNDFPGRSPIDHYAFTVRDLDAAKVRVKELWPEAEFTEDLQLWDSMRCSFVNGPDGEKLEFFERRE